MQPALFGEDGQSAGQHDPAVRCGGDPAAAPVRILYRIVEGMVRSVSRTFRPQGVRFQ